MKTGHRCWVEVSRSRIVANFRALVEVVGKGVEVVPVVKADAYRHGAVEVSRAALNAGARWVAVSSVDEGVALRAGGIGAQILVMADFLPVSRQALLDYRLTPVLHSLDDIRELHRLASARNTLTGYHLKIDSGMGRLGTRASASEIAQAIGTSKSARLEGLMTHFASAADYDSGQTEEQTACFDALRAEIAALGIHPRYMHAASTIAIAYGRRETWYNMVRPGHAIYGYVSPLRSGASDRLIDVRPALAWKAALIAVKDVPAGAKIGYGAIFVAPRAMRIGIVGAGYADGVPHRLGNRGKLIAGGRPAPILGAVSMDVTTVDLSQAMHLVPGDTVTILGTEGDTSQDAQQLAKTAATISYSLLCGISARVTRVYVD